MRGRVAAAIAAAILVGSLSACGAFNEAHSYNAPSPTVNVIPSWTRIESPYHYNTIIRACVGPDGVYENLSNDNSVTVVPNDPDC